MLFKVAALWALCLVGCISATCQDASDQHDCTDILANNLGYPPASGRYHLLVGKGKRSLWAYCDMKTDGGGWTVFQKRTSAALSFNKTFAEYENGFGSVTGDHWLGNTYLHSLTVGKRYVLRIEFTDWGGKMNYAEYDDFRVGGAGCNYKLESLGTFCGNCGDSFTAHLGQAFTTYDRDNDKDPKNCAKEYKGAWWFYNCHVSNLNGEYKQGGPHDSFADGIEWFACKGYQYSFKTTVMMIRPYDF